MCDFSQKELEEYRDYVADICNDLRITFIGVGELYNNSLLKSNNFVKVNFYTEGVSELLLYEEWRITGFSGPLPVLKEFTEDILNFFKVKISFKSFLMLETEWVEHITFARFKANGVTLETSRLGHSPESIESLKALLDKMKIKHNIL